MKRAALLLLCLPLFLELAAQGFGQRKWPDLIPLDGKMKRGGLYVAPGVTYLLSRKHEVHYGPIDGTGDIYYEPRGDIGLYLEAGWFHATRDPVILDYWDFGVAYKQLRGHEVSSGLLTAWGDTTAYWTEGRSTFNDRYLNVHVNANKFIQTGRYQFVQLSLGANGDFDIGSQRAHEGVPRNGQQYPPGVIAQAHVKLGYGFKMTQRLFVIPAVETPVFSVLPKDQGFGELQWFSSNYRPLIFSVRFLFLRYPNGFACPPVRTTEEDRQKHKVYKEQYTRP